MLTGRRSVVQALILLALCGGVFAQTQIELSTQAKGTLPAAQMPALSGAVTSSAGSTATSPGKVDVLDSSYFCQAAGASSTTYTCNLSPAITAYVTGTHYRFKADVANSAASTINFNSQGAKSIKKAAGGITTDVVANDLRAGQWIDLVYDGTNMQMQSTSGNAGGGAGTVNSGTAGQPAVYVTTAAAVSGVTPASFRSSTYSNVESATAHGDSVYTILATDRVVYTNAAFTASRTWTLPAASAVNAGGVICVADLQGTLTGTNTLVISRGGTDTINGAGVTVTFSAPNDGGCFVSDGTSKWSFNSATTSVANGGTGTGSTLTGLVRGDPSAMTAAELSGDVTTSGSNAATVVATHLTSSDSGDATTGNAVRMANNVLRVTSNFTSASNTNLQTITGLTWTLAANLAQVVNFHCFIAYSQATNVADSFGIQAATIAPNSIDAMGWLGTATTATTFGALAGLATTTATAIVTATPTVTTTNGVELAGTIDNPSNASTNVINIQVKQATAADVIVVKKGSWCKIW